MAFIGNNKIGGSATYRRRATGGTSAVQRNATATLARNPEIDRIRGQLEQRPADRQPLKRFPGRRAGDNPRVSLVIPARNEAKNLPLVFANIPHDVFEIVLVDGASSDGTPHVALELRDDVRIVNQTRNGKGNALVCGFAACRGDIIVTIDADGSMDANEIPLYVNALIDGADFARGSRFLKGGGSADITKVRAAGNHALRLTVNTLFGTRYSDLCYGYCAFWRHALPHLTLDRDGFEMETMMNVLAHTAGLRVAEVPTWESERIHGESKLNAVRDGWQILKAIIVERLTPRRRRRRQADAPSATTAAAAG